MYWQQSFHHTAIASGLIIAAISLNAPWIANAQQSTPRCTPAAAVARVPALPEGSGLAASRRKPGQFWSHNDSGDPALIALDHNGRVAGRLQLSGATVEDWEAVAVGPCASGSCIYVGDIGDNDAERAQVTVYRFAEPAEPAGSAKGVDVIRATYPDRPQDAETLLVTPDGRMYIVTKGDTGPVSLYRFPNDLRRTVQLERIGGPRDQRSGTENDRITDGAVSPDGQWIVLRTTEALTFHRAAELLGGNWREAARVALTSLGEPQGEGVTFGADSAVYLISEAGDKKQPGLFARLTCSLNP